MTASAEFLAQIETFLGPRGFTKDPDLMDPWLTDWRGRFSGKAAAMISPTSTPEVSEVVKLCAKHGVAIVPQGGNSGMCGGATPDESGDAVIISLRRMNSVRSFDVEARQIVCDAGVVLQTLHETVEAERLRFPLTLGGKGSATIGGLISTNAGGTQVLRHGVMRDQVLGVEAVLADGSVFDGLTVLKKDNRGFDLKQMLIGSEGTLGIVTGATLRLLPETGTRTVAWAGVESIAMARQLLLLFQRRAEQFLEGFEVIPAHSLAAVLEHVPSTRSPLADTHNWNALIELVGSPDQSDILPELAQELLTEAIGSGLAQDATVASNESQAEAFWLLRDEIASAERAIGPAMQHDISVPVERMADFVEYAVPAVRERFPDTTPIAFGHLGDGNVHFHVLAPAGATRGEWEDSQGKTISAYVHDLVTQWEGSISAEHGIGQMKRDELGRLGDPVANAMLRGVKQALDPQGILNPGKLVPLARHGQAH
ncbi:FAD-binding oxidoreductase [Altererythrobacter sp. MF3-039]|uniref:FAD-binding oxidoreductase n=1 Tax=Altererythrobacter sp. MF3-039 TaxID=3252901 RepID=UPI00390CB7C2